MKIRSYTWGAADLSWSVVMEEVLYCAKKRGHEVDLISTNGTAGMMYWNERLNADAVMSERIMRQKNIPYDLDIVYTVPENFPRRFLSNSKYKMGRYDYESSHMPSRWNKFYNIVDFVLPSSRYVAAMFKRNGCPEEKIAVVPHGVDISKFNPNVSPEEIPSEKSFKFLAVAAPHYRKQIPELLDVYCKTFTSKDDVTLVLKTKLFKQGEERKPFEVDLTKTLAAIKRKYGASMPEITILDKKINNMAGLYTACNTFALMTASEGWGMPFLESLACGLPVIAPRFGGQIDFLNNKNSLLTNCGTRKAKKEEQYWGATEGATTGEPDPSDFSDKMVHVYKNYGEVKSQLMPEMLATAQRLTWDNTFNQICALMR